MLIQIADHTAARPKNPAGAPVEVGAYQTPPGNEIVNLSNGNLHLSVPIRPAPRNRLPGYSISEQSSYAGVSGRMWSALRQGAKSGG
jgi:hypothetical protein